MLPCFETYRKYQSLLKENSFCYITGRVQEREDKAPTCTRPVGIGFSGKCWILIENRENDFAIARILERYKGPIPVILHYQDRNETIKVEQFSVVKSPQLVEELAEFVMKTVFR